MRYQDYYATLGVPKEASKEEIRSAFRKLARKYHPDINKDPAAEVKFKEINEAYEVLGDEEKRQAYDSFGANWQNGQEFTPPPGWEDIFRQGAPGGQRHGHQHTTFATGGLDGFSDFFNAFFGGAGAGDLFSSGFRGDFDQGGARQRVAAQKGQSIEADLLVTIEDVLHGGTKKISFDVRSADGSSAPIRKSYSVKIPPGTKEGSVIRLTGQGGPGMNGGADGDLMLRVRLAEHPYFKAKGFNIISEVPVTPWEAALGARVKVLLPGGEEIQMSVPENAQSGQKLRLKGKGFLKKSGERGHIYVVLKIKNPDCLSDQERELYQQLAQGSDFNPRRS